MTPFPWTDLLMIAGLVVLNGLFSMSELAIVSARPARLKLLVERGRRGARAALALSEDPGTLLSTAQIGITLIALVTGALSEASLGTPVAQRLEALGIPHRFADETGLVLVMGITTFVSLIAGELVPKQLALRMAEPIACLAAPVMARLARWTAPLVWVLDRSSQGVLRLLGVKHTDEPSVTEEELHLMFAEATRSGVIEEDEREIMTGIMRLAGRPVREVMTPRNQMDWIDVNASETAVRERIAASPHSIMPIGDGSPDTILGVAKVRQILAVLLSGRTLSLRRLMKKAEIIPDQLDAMDALRILQQSGISMALVHDEYGHLEGIVTPADLLSAIVGNFVSHQDDGEGPMVIEREDGSLLISGALPADALSRRLGLDLPEHRDYATTAGFALSVMKRFPDEGDVFEVPGWRFEIVDMDGRKIDKLLVSKIVVAEVMEE
ncbi:hemolysin family protein [Novosphingobium terrae]|uniref:hemolysin family protein n=1 Tax=Novosphingobium terrae TaxID=2726189 RepID=UPI00197DE26B|nr:hemolysin family protein [Novosphingobium terrae]